jgi:hypothetical protein
MRPLLLVIFLLSIISIESKAQEDQNKSVNGYILDFGIGLGANIPLADLKDRYGSNLNFSLGGDLINKNNWLINGEYIYMFSDNVKEDVLAPYRTPTRFLLGDDEQLAEIIMRERCFYLGIGIGRIIPLQKETRSGIKLLVNAGILQHQIKFADERNSLAQIRAGRSVGYDRLTRGFSLKETIAYKHLSADKRLNFEFALDFIQGFTSEVRAFNFDTQLPTNKSRFDMIIGARIVWNLPFYKGGVEKTIFY